MVRQHRPEVDQWPTPTKPIRRTPASVSRLANKSRFALFGKKKTAGTGTLVRLVPVDDKDVMVFGGPLGFCKTVSIIIIKKKSPLRPAQESYSLQLHENKKRERFF